jgi:hypothetical protein
MEIIKLQIIEALGIEPRVFGNESDFYIFYNSTVFDSKDSIKREYVQYKH